MLGLRDSSTRKSIIKTPSLAEFGSIRKSSAGSSGVNTNKRSSWRCEVLQERLEELLVYELLDTGEKKHLHLSVRGLYKYILNAITQRRPVTKQKSAIARSLQEAMADPAPLGRVMVQPTSSFVSSLPTMASQAQDLEDIPTVPPELPTGDELDQGASPPHGGKRRSMHRRRESMLHGEQVITRRERLGGYLHPRDLRRLVTPFSASNEPEIMARRHVVLLNFDPIRAIILRDRLLVLVPDGVENLTERIEQLLVGGQVASDDSIFGDDEEGSESGGEEQHKTSLFGRILKRRPSSTSKRKGPKDSNGIRNLQATVDAVIAAVSTTTDDAMSDLDVLEENENDENGDGDDEDENASEWEDMNRRDWIDLPFELQALDAVMTCVCEILSEDTLELQQTSLDYIQQLINHKLNGDPLTIIRAVKDAVREMTARTRGFVKSVTRLLDEEEDLMLVNLTRIRTHPELYLIPVPPEVIQEESDEPELILESFLQVGLSLTNALDLIQGQVHSASELVQQQLDSTRNKILLANMILTVVTICLSGVAVVSSVYGMNLANPLEEIPAAFDLVVWTSLAGFLCLFFVIIAILVFFGAIPRYQIGNTVA